MCASTLALMDGGVPILAPVAGIAIGPMQKKNTPVKTVENLMIDFKNTRTLVGKALVS